MISTLSTISTQLKVPQNQVSAVLKLANEGATIPFIARYRKEATGELDELSIESIIQLNKQLIELNERREFILKTIEEQGNLSAELKNEIEQATKLQTLEDLYLPFKPKRQTRGQKAIQKGLEPLAKSIFSLKHGNVVEWAKDFISDEVSSQEEAIAGALDITSEWINESAEIREILRVLFKQSAFIVTKMVANKAEEGQKFADYFEYEELLSRCPSHRYLAIRRGVDEGILRMSIEPDSELALEKIERKLLKQQNNAATYLKESIADAYKRLLQPSLETEFKNSKKEEADKQAIDVFGENLRQLLLASPLGKKRILALDPGYRTGCKLVCLSETGELLHHTVIYPHAPQNQWQESKQTLQSLIKKYQLEVIAIGNGTASRESEQLARNCEFELAVQVLVVSEAGASVYSASEVARKEFPEYDVTVRGAISIGRRVLDPLAELVKIDPKAIGVGQYQHDVDQSKLKQALDRIVESCVNQVGVDLNTASEQLLSYVSGLGPSLAKQIVKFRSENGVFSSRKQLKDVPRLGSKAFEQAAGFLRIPESKNPLDSSAVHPERYQLVEAMAKSIGVSSDQLIRNAINTKKLNLSNFVSDDVGLPTLNDILSELEKPGRDPRGEFKVFSFDDNVKKIEDLEEGMELPGLVTNITDFGAFVDVGVKQDGLVHISKMANKFISHPTEVVKLGQEVSVTVESVDVSRKRISLSMI